MKAAARPAWRPGGRPGRGRARARADRRPARNGHARAARPNAGAGVARGGPTPRGIEAEAGGGGATGRGRAGADAGTGEPGTRGRTREGARRGAGRRRVASRARRGWPRGHPPHPPGDRGGGGGAAKPTRGPRSGDHRSARGRRTPPTDSWGVRRPRGGQDARPIRPRMGPGRRQAPRRPHDAGRPIRDVAGTTGCRRPARGGRPMLGDGGPSPEGLWESPRPARHWRRASVRVSGLFGSYRIFDDTRSTGQRRGSMSHSRRTWPAAPEPRPGPRVWVILETRPKSMTGRGRLARLMEVLPGSRKPNYSRGKNAKTFGF